MKIDVVITAARRPDLFGKTAASFHKRMLSRFDVNDVFINIDPIWGEEKDGDTIENIARDYFPRVILRRPSRASFGGAVKWLWSQPTADWFLHMEDDWVLRRNVSPCDLENAITDPRVVQVRLANWKRLQRRRRPPTFSTSPTLVRSDFGRLSSKLLNPDLDPEKQFRNDTNIPLQTMAGEYKAIYFGTAWTRQTAQDIGRLWREKRKITKLIVNGTSIWHQS